MLQENVEVIRAAYEAWKRGESWSELLDPEIEWDVSAYPGLDALVRGRGRENFLQFLDKYRRAWIGYEAAPRELIDAGDDVVVVLHEAIRARGTEMLVERDMAAVWTMREGRAVRMRAYGTKPEALTAAGLSE